MRQKPTKPNQTTADQAAPEKRAYVSQADVPRYTLEEALRVPRALSDFYAKQPTKPLRVADALKIAPTTGHFRNLTSAAVAYGLTDGTAWASEIRLTDLGRKIVAPLESGEDDAAKRQAIMKPRVIREFLQRYDGSKLPPEHIAANVLSELGVPRDAAERTLNLIRRNAEELGLLRTINGQIYVDLQLARDEHMPEREQSPPGSERDSIEVPPSDIAPPVGPIHKHASDRRVFITHGRNAQIVQQLKELLTFGSFEPVIAVEHESLAKPVPAKVLDEMRSCGAAIVHVGTERKLLDSDGKEVTMLNPNVLIEIGAAMALYGNRFILLVERGVSLPSNLQGLYEVRYEGDRLDYESTMKLLKAFNEFRS